MKEKPQDAKKSGPGRPELCRPVFGCSQARVAYGLGMGCVNQRPRCPRPTHTTRHDTTPTRHRAPNQSKPGRTDTSTSLGHRADQSGIRVRYTAPRLDPTAEPET